MDGPLCQIPTSTDYVTTEYGNFESASRTAKLDGGQCFVYVVKEESR